jgi:D-alanyl-D-alanine carboxypeptidase
VSNALIATALFVCVSFAAFRHLKYRSAWLPAALLAAGVPSVWASTPPVAEEVEALITDFMTANQIPGLSIGVVKNGQVALARGFGSANLEADTAASESTVYPLASLTKQFTAAGIMLLAQQGKLSLDDTVGGRVDGIPESWRTITIRQLLNHTSGIPDFVAAADFARLSARHHAPGEILGWVSSQPLHFPPGEGWKYSNTNYFLLGLIIERISGREYGAFLAGQIFRPLGMSATRLDTPGRGIRNRAQGYVWKDGKLHLADRASPTVAYSAGGVVGTVVDFVKWQQALQVPRLLSPASLGQMWAPTRLPRGEIHPYGFGWRIHAKHNCVSHSGHVQGAAAFMASCPARNFAVVLLANLEHADLEPLSGRIAEVYSRP